MPAILSEPQSTPADPLPMFSEAERGIFIFELFGRKIARDPFIVSYKWNQGLIKFGRRDPQLLLKEYGSFEEYLSVPTVKAIYERADPTEISQLEQSDGYIMLRDAANKAALDLAASFRVALDLPPVAEDGSGVPINAILTIFNTWCDFRSELKKSTGGSPDSSQPSDSPPASDLS